MLLLELKESLLLKRGSIVSWERTQLLQPVAWLESQLCSSLDEMKGVLDSQLLNGNAKRRIHLNSV